MRRYPILLLAAVAGFSAALAAGIAGARSFTLELAKNAKVTDRSGATKHETIVVNGHGFAVYSLTGDSARHPECTAANRCFGFWPPVKVKSAKGLSKAPGVKGRLGTWHRDGFEQVTLGGHPLYRFSVDKHRDAATGDGLRSFGGTWHVVSQGSAGSGSGGTTSTGTTGAGTTGTGTTGTGTGTTGTGTGTTGTGTGTTGTGTNCLYPPYCY